MALGKPIMTPRGQATFWIIGTTWKDNFNKTAFISLYGYGSKEHCDMEGAVPITKLDINIYPDTFDDYFKDETLKQEGKSELTESYRALREKIEALADAEDLIYTEV